MTFQYKDRSEIVQRLNWAGSWHSLIVQQMCTPESMPDALMVIKASQLIAAWEEYQLRCRQIEKLIKASNGKEVQPS
jgi:hypothetical protein